jgi:hypothetical protein
MAEEQEIAEGPPAHSDPFAFSFLWCEGIWRIY